MYKNLNLFIFLFLNASFNSIESAFKLLSTHSESSSSNSSVSFFELQQPTNTPQTSPTSRNDQDSRTGSPSEDRSLQESTRSDHASDHTPAAPRALSPLPNKKRTLRDRLKGRLPANIDLAKTITANNRNGFECIDSTVTDLQITPHPASANPQTTAQTAPTDHQASLKRYIEILNFMTVSAV